MDTTLAASRMQKFRPRGKPVKTKLGTMDYLVFGVVGVLAIALLYGAITQVIPLLGLQQRTTPPPPPASIAAAVLQNVNGTTGVGIVAVDAQGQETQFDGQIEVWLRPARTPDLRFTRQVRRGDFQPLPTNGLERGRSGVWLKVDPSDWAQIPPAGSSVTADITLIPASGSRVSGSYTLVFPS
jgi:hypothetical protein